MNWWYVAAAVAAVATGGMHVMLGGPEAARPLLDSTELTPGAKFTNYYCWHLVTISIAGLAAAYSWAARSGAAPDLGIFATGGSFLSALWSLGMIWKFQLPAMQFPQWTLFLTIGVLGLIGSLR